MRKVTIWFLMFHLLFFVVDNLHGEEKRSVLERVVDSIETLGDSNYAVRERAEATLHVIGGRAFKTVKAAEGHADPEIRERIRRLLYGPKRIYPVSPVDLGLRWLANNQEKDGSWNAMKYGATEVADLECTAMALLAFLGSGHTEKVGKYKRNVKQAIAYIKSCQRKDGALAEKNTQSINGEVHAKAGIALSEAAGMGRVLDTIRTARAALNYSADKHQYREDFSDYGGFGIKAMEAKPGIRMLAVCALHYKSAKVSGCPCDPAIFDGLYIALKPLAMPEVKLYRARKGEAPDKTSTLSGLVVRQVFGGSKEDLAGIAEKAIEQFGPPTVGQKSSDEWGNYLGTMVALQQGGDLWKKWHAALKKSITLNQRDVADPKIFGSWDPAGKLASKGRVMATVLNLLCLEVYYRYLPMYK